jgi:lipopolysaccharide/colanic/teichoic acid biosynthesis glycosyltransferase
VDEIPQFWNVLKGDMSLVGPRPLQPGEAGDYPEYLRIRQRVKPGLTSFWAAGDRSLAKPENRMRSDLQYVEEQSLLTDIRLVVQTIPVVLTGRGAE